MITFLMTIDDSKTRSKLEELYKTYYKEMYITAYSILRDHHEAEDVVQNAIIRLSNNLKKISKIKCKKTRSYLVIIVRNLSYNVYNKRKKLYLIEHSEVQRLPDTEEILMEEQLIKASFSLEMDQYLKHLHQPYLDILTLRYYYELEIKEISNLLDITDNNVYVRIHRALTALKEILKKEGVNYEQTL
jgi:RNA polymerase sigma-70 factor (ECF subfamily)